MGATFRRPNAHPPGEENGRIAGEADRQDVQHGPDICIRPNNPTIWSPIKYICILHIDKHMRRATLCGIICICISVNATAEVGILKMPVSLCYAKTMGRALLRNRALWISAIVIALFSCIFLVYPVPFSSDSVMYDVYQEQLSNIRTNLTDHTYRSDIPEWESEALTTMESLLDKTIENWNTPERVSYLADYLEVEAGFTRRVYENGTLASEYYMVLLGEGTAQVMRGIANLPSPVLYSNTVDLPPAAYLLDLVSDLPYFLWYIPLLIAITACAKERETDTLLASAPMRRSHTVFALFSLLLAFSLVTLLAEWLPACVFAFLRNGPDDFAYPIAFVSNDVLYTSTVGFSMLKWVTGFMAESALFCLIAALCLTLKAPRAAQVVVAVALAIPMLPGYLTGTVPSELLKFLPTTYLEATRFVGVPRTCASLIESGVGCTFQAGMVCAAAWFVGILAFGALACVMSHLSRIRSQGGSRA